MTETLYAGCEKCASINRFDGSKPEKALCGECGAALDPSRATSDRPLNVTDATFQDVVISSKIPVMVDFFTQWCGACRSIEYALEAIAAGNKGKLKVLMLDIENNPETARKYEIRATPTLIIFRDGQSAEQVVGAVPESQLQELAKRYVA
jgi:thioredoxin